MKVAMKTKKEKKIEVSGKKGMGDKMKSKKKGYQWESYMPAAYKRCVKHVEAKGHATSSAHAICTSVNAGGVKQTRAQEHKTNVKKRYGK